MRKNSLFALSLVLVLSMAVSSCRYGEEEAAASIKRNQDYKTAKAADAPAPINPDYIKGGGASAAPVAPDSTAAPAPTPATK